MSKLLSRTVLPPLRKLDFIVGTSPIFSSGAKLLRLVGLVIVDWTQDREIRVRIWAVPPRPIRNILGQGGNSHALAHQAIHSSGVDELAPALAGVEVPLFGYKDGMWLDELPGVGAMGSICRSPVGHAHSTPLHSSLFRAAKILKLK
jgi:hypothetical protein